MGVNMKLCDDIMTVMINGDIDHHTARIIREQIDEKIEQSFPRQLIIDMKNVDFMDSSGIGLILGRYRIMLLYKGGVKIANANKQVSKVLKISGVDKLIEIIAEGNLSYESQKQC